MARYCKVCKQKLSFFYRKPICKHCITTKYDIWFLNKKILELPKRTDQEILQLTLFGYEKYIPIYHKLLKEYTSDGVMPEYQINDVERIYKLFKLPPNQSQEFSVILPHKVRNSIVKNGILPIVDKEYFDNMDIQLGSDEKFFCAGFCNLYELGRQSTYVRGSRGVTVFGFRGVGRVEGQRVSHTVQRLKTQGDFVMTDKRFYYIPNTHGSIIKLDISKIIKFDYDDEFLVVYKPNRQKPHLFKMSEGNIKICKLGLDFIRT